MAAIGGTDDGRGAGIGYDGVSLLPFTPLHMSDALSVTPPTVEARQAAVTAALDKATAEAVRELRMRLSAVRLTPTGDVPSPFPTVGQLLRRGSRGVRMTPSWGQPPLDRELLWASVRARVADLLATGPAQAPLASLPAAEVAKVASEPEALAWYTALVPIVSGLSHLSVKPARGEAAPEPVATLATVRQLIEQLQQIQERLGSGKIQRTLVPAATLPHLAEELAGQAFLPADAMADGFELAHAESWHTKPRTRHVAGGFTEALRERVEREGDPRLLMLLAASSDGRNRTSAASSQVTPVPVWEKLIYDNSLAVLSAVAAHPRFNDTYAYAMMDTGLAPQITAVMLHGRVHAGVRVMAARQAIAHPGVDPSHVYQFLMNTRGNAEVPLSLWTELVNTVQQRLRGLEAAGDTEGMKRYTERLSSIRKNFAETVLLPWAEARKQMLRHAPAGADIETLLQSGTEPPALSYYARQTWRQSRQFLAAHEFLRDPRILDMMVEGARTPEQLSELLGLHRDCGFPVGKRLLLRLLQHPDPAVRLDAMRLVSKKDDVEVDVVAAQLQADIQAEHAQIAAHVQRVVIPDYEKIEGEARRVSRMHHHFAAARHLDAATLERAFVTTAEQDPRRIPAVIRELATAAMLPPVADVADDPDAGRPMQQGDLFGERAVAPATDAPRPLAARRTTR